MTRETTWLKIEAQARAQVRAELDRETATALQPGTFVAWALTRFGHTDGISAVHRIGQPLDGSPATLCMEDVPEPILRVPLSRAMIRTLDHCQYCEAIAAQNGVAA